MRDLPAVFALVPLSLMQGAESYEGHMGDSNGDNPKGRRRRFRPIHLLLLIPYVAMLWVPSYNRVEPMLAGIPFFYWYQMLWIVLGVAVLVPVYFSDERQR
jgi:hypothetical protein